MEELPVSSLRGEGGGALGRQDGPGDVLQTLLQGDLRAARPTVNSQLIPHSDAHAQ